MRPLAVLALLLALGLAACGEDDGAPPTVSPTAPSASPTPSASPLASPSPPSTPTPTPDLTSLIAPVPFNAPKLVFRRGQKDFYLNAELWLANIDGSDPVQLTPSGVKAGFAGATSNAKSGRNLFYYYIEDGGGAYTIWSLDLSTGQRARLRQFDAWGESMGVAAVNSAGTHIAFADKDGLWLLELASGSANMVLKGGNRDECGVVGIAACKAYRALVWSPGGTLLGVQPSYWEGGEFFILDPFVDRANPVHGGEFGGGHWSPDGRRFCTWGRYADTSALYVATAPDWSIGKYFEEFEAANPTATVTDCGWLDNSRLIVTAARTDPSGTTDAWLLDLATGARSRIAEFPAEQPNSRSVVEMPDGAGVVTQAVKSSDPLITYVGPVILSADGSARPILEPGDWVIAVIVP